MFHRHLAKCPYRPPEELAPALALLSAVLLCSQSAGPNFIKLTEPVHHIPAVKGDRHFLSVSNPREPWSITLSTSPSPLPPLRTLSANDWQIETPVKAMEH